MSTTANLKRALHEAIDYVGMVGKNQPHLNSVGKLHTLTIATEINFQHQPSTTNYWKNSAFDVALGMVVRKRFNELAGEALALMGADYKKAVLSEKDALLAKLAEIEALEKEAAQ